jgi:hypothetical protein
MVNVSEARHLTLAKWQISYTTAIVSYGTLTSSTVQ